MELSANIEDQIHALLIKEERECISVVDPEILKNNITSFQNVLRSYRFKSQIHYVMKVNESGALIRAARGAGCRIDVSSYGELLRALELGHTGDMITANGPKNKKFIRKCMEVGCTIAVDNLSELRLINSLDSPSKILVRLGGFDAKPSTRFGVLKEIWHELYDELDKLSEHVDLIGVSFHVDMIDVKWKVKLFWEAIEFIRKLPLEQRKKIKIINIGGSFGASYTDNRSHKTIACTRISERRSYPDFSGHTGAELLYEFLQTNTDMISIAKFLEENTIELWIEPGRALLYNTTILATTCIGLREHKFEKSIIINTNSFNLGMNDEVLPCHPYLMGRNNKVNQLNSYWVLGNLCKEGDTLYSYPIDFSDTISIDDVIIFPQMGAYKRDFYSCQAILHPQTNHYYINKQQELCPDF